MGPRPRFPILRYGVRDASKLAAQRRLSQMKSSAPLVLDWLALDGGST